MWVSCTAARSCGGENAVIRRTTDSCEGSPDEWGSVWMGKSMQILLKKETCSLLTVKLRLGWGGAAAVLLDAATLEDADGALGRFEDPGRRGDVVVGGGGGDVSGGAPALSLIHI